MNPIREIQSRELRMNETTRPRLDQLTGDVGQRAREVEQRIRKIARLDLRLRRQTAALFEVLCALYGAVHTASEDKGGVVRVVDETRDCHDATSSR